MKNLRSLAVLILAAAPAAAQNYAASARVTALPALGPVLPGAAFTTPSLGAIGVTPLGASQFSVPAFGAAPLSAAAAAVLPVAAKSVIPLGAQAVVPAAATRVSPIAQLSAAAEQPADAPNGRVFDGGMLRPVLEQWEIDGKAYHTTKDMLEALPRSDKPVSALYRYSNDATPAPNRLLTNGAVGAVSGGIIGAVAGLVLVLLATSFAPLLDLLLGGSGSAGPVSPFGEVGIFGSMGAFAGGLIALSHPAPEREIVHIPGQIIRQAGEKGETVYFQTTGRSRPVLVDLGAFAAAPKVTAPAAPAPWPVWKSVAAGAAAGIVLALTQWVPLVQIVGLFVAGPFAGYTVGKALSAGTGVSGGLLGGSLGLLIPVGAMVSFAAVSTGAGILASFGVYAAILAVLGAVLGGISANAVRAYLSREAALKPTGQWWANRGG